MVYFEMWKIVDTEKLVLSLGKQRIEFDMSQLDDLKQEIRGWELRYYED